MIRPIPIFADLVLILAVSLPVLLLMRRLRLPPIAGFVLTGILIGPFGLGWVHQIEHVHTAAGIGVVLLMFTVGLQVSMSRLFAMSGRIYLIAAGQIVATCALAFAASMFLGLNLVTSLVIGFVITHSSSTVILKGLSDKGELETPLGGLVLAVILVQDIAVIPMLLVVDFLGNGQADLATISQVTLQAVVLGAALYFAGRYVLPPLMRRLVTVSVTETVLLFAILVMLVTAWLTATAGLSLAVGAFAAGLILSETDYYPQIYAEFVPFRTLFSSLFFVSVGMLLDLNFVMAHPLPVLGVAVGVLVLKVLVVFGITLPLRMSPVVGLQSGLYLSAIGELSFLIIGAAIDNRLLSQNIYQYLMATASLTLAVTPLIMQWAPSFAWRAGMRFPWLTQLDEKTPISLPAGRPQPAVLIVGYGVNGHNVAHVLGEAGIHHEILESNPEIVRRVRRAGKVIHFGDATGPEVLRQLAVQEFDSAVLAISDVAATRRAVTLLRSMNPQLHLIVRTRYVAESEDLKRLGASLVIPEEFETSLRIFSELLRHYGIPPYIIGMQIELVRSESYGILRSDKQGAFTEELHELLLKRLVQAVPITAQSPAYKRTLRELGLTGEKGCQVIAVLRDGQPLSSPLRNILVEAGDLIVLYGNHADLHQAVQALSGYGM
ncbi:MAG: cation:proton antiporter [bacterium]